MLVNPNDASSLTVTEDPRIVSISPDSHHLINPHPLESLLPLGDVAYGITPLAHGVHPAAVVELGPSVNISETIDKFIADTEFDSQFLRAVVFVMSTRNEGTTDLVKNAWPFLMSKGCKSVFISTGGPILPPEGPWFMIQRRLHQTWRLFPDIHEAFQLPTIHDANSDKLSFTTQDFFFIRADVPPESSA